MSQDTVADTLNRMMNALRARKQDLEVKIHSRFLLSVLAIAKLKGYVESYHVDSNSKNLKIKIGKLNLTANENIFCNFSIFFLLSIFNAVV